MAIPPRSPPIRRRSTLVSLQKAAEDAPGVDYSPSGTLYPECASLRARLSRVVGFRGYLDLSMPDDNSTHPVHHIWNTFCLGSSLCFLYNKLPSETYARIHIDDSLESLRTYTEFQRRFAVAMFSVNLRHLDRCEPFGITELFDKTTPTGILKVIRAVRRILDLLPAEAVEKEPTKDRLKNLIKHPKNLTSQSESVTKSIGDTTLECYTSNLTYENEWKTAVRNLILMERRYMEDLEELERFSRSMIETKRHVVEHVFSPSFFIFQRKHLIRMECTAELPWTKQRWGRHFKENASVLNNMYHVFCINRIIAAEELERTSGVHCHPDNLVELLDRPQKYLAEHVEHLKVLQKLSSAANLQYTKELEESIATSSKVVNKVNDEVRRAQTDKLVKSLNHRVQDWKGHELHTSGPVHLFGTFHVEKGGVGKEQHVFLFEKCLLCFKEEDGSPTSGQQDSSLVMKGRIFIGNVTTTAKSTEVPSSLPRYDIETRTASDSSWMSSASNEATDQNVYPFRLAVFYRANATHESSSLILSFPTQEQMNSWDAEIRALKHKWTNQSIRSRAHQKHSSLPDFLSPDKSPTSPPPTAARARGASDAGSKTVKLRLLCSDEDFYFTIHIPVDITFEDLKERIQKKLRNSAVPQAAEGPLLMLREWEDDNLSAISSIEELKLENIGKEKSKPDFITLMVK